MDFGWGAGTLSPAGGTGSDLNLLSDHYIDLDDKTLQCLMGGPSAGFTAYMDATTTSNGAGPVVGGEAASGSGKREREEDIVGAALDDAEDGDSEEGGRGGGRARPSKKGKAALSDAATVKACREKARREKLNECFEELARLCDPTGKMMRTDRISIVQDAIRALGALRVENNQLRQLNKFLEERVRHHETSRAQGMYQMMMQQQQVAMQQQQQLVQQAAPQQVAMQPQAQQPDAAAAAVAAAAQQQQQMGIIASSSSGMLQQAAPAAHAAGQPDMAQAAGSGVVEGPVAGEAVTLAAHQQPAAAEQQQQQVAPAPAPAQPQQQQQQQMAAVQVPPGMMLVPVPTAMSAAGGPAAAPAAAAMYAQPYLVKTDAMDPMPAPPGLMTAGGSGAFMMATPTGMAAAMVAAPGMMQAAPAGGALPQMAALPQVMPANAPPVAWLPAPDISQDQKLRPPAA